jgi:hypothetical protein
VPFARIAPTRIATTRVAIARTATACTETAHTVTACTATARTATARTATARITTAAAVTVLFALAGCDHAPPPPAAAPEPAATAVPLETGTGSPAATTVPSPSSASSHAAPKRTTKPAADVDAGSGSAGLDRFVAAVQQKLPDVALDRRDEEVEDLGEQACDALEGGRSATAAAGAVAEQGVEPADARTLVGLARTDLCRP